MRAVAAAKPGLNFNPGAAISAQAASPRRKLILAACLMASFMAAIESTIVATAMPSIVGELGGFELFSWVFTAFMLTQAVSIPVYGRLADMFGRKLVFFAGVGLFLVGSILCGLAPTMGLLICFRAVQGLGAGAVQPMAATILGDIYTPAERAHVQGLISCVFGVAALAGPLLGAILIDQVAWAWIFWINIPIGIISFAMVGMFLRESATPRDRSIDWFGAVVLLLASGSLILVLVQGGQFPPIVTGCLFAISLLSGALLIIHERAIPEPMLPLELWRTSRVIVVGSLGSCAAGAMMMGIAAFLPPYVQGVMGYGTVVSGTVLGAMSISWALASLLGARIMQRTSYRAVAIMGAIALVAGAAILVMVPPAMGPVPVGIGSFIVGVGMGFCISVFVVSIQASVPWHQRGAATSSTMFLRFMGQVIGTAGCGAVLNATIAWMDPGAAKAMDQIMNAAGRAALPAAELGHLTATIAVGLRNAWLLAALFALATLVFAFLMPAGLSPTRTAVDAPPTQGQNARAAGSRAAGTVPQSSWPGLTRGPLAASNRDNPPEMPLSRVAGEPPARPGQYNDTTRSEAATGRRHAETLSEAAEDAVGPTTPASELQAVIATAAMDLTARERWCREHGIQPADLDTWKRAVVAALREARDDGRLFTARDRQRIEELEDELRRKDKALAEMATLVALSRKLAAIFHDLEVA